MIRVTPRVAITATFFADGALFASFAARIPALQEQTHASTGALGLALLAPAVGAVLAMPRAGRLLHRAPSRNVVRAGLVAIAVTTPVLAIPHAVALLGVLLLAYGAARGSLDVAMNAHGMTVERGLRRPVLSSLHAAWSFGGFAGAGLGALAAAAGLDPLPHLLAAAALFVLPTLAATRVLLPADADPDAEAPHLKLRRLPRRLALLGAAGFLALLAEGGASDWSATLVAHPLDGGPALGAIAYAVFAGAMGAGRLVTDRLWARWGAHVLLRRAGLLAGLGFAAALAIGTAPVALAGFLALGLGLSGVVPTLFRAGAEQPGVPSGAGIAAVASIAYTGMLAGPPAVGGLAELTGLRAATGLVALAALAIAVLGPAAAAPARRTRPAAAAGAAGTG